MLQTIATIDTLPSPTRVEQHQRMRLRDEILLLSAIAVIAALLIGLPAFLRHFSYLLLLIAFPALLIEIHKGTERWTPFAPAVATALTGWILATRMTRYLPSRKRSKNHPDSRSPAAAAVD